MEALIRAALDARNNAYAPYSHFLVGAAIMGKDGRIFTGCNMENAAYPAGICAERAALSHAISEGARLFTAIAIVGGPEGTPEDQLERCAPCGICRQCLSEFCAADMPVLFYHKGEGITVPFGDLLPMGFSKEALK